MTPTTDKLQVLIDVYINALASDYPYTNQELSRMQTAFILAQAELSRREAEEVKPAKCVCRNSADPHATSPCFEYNPHCSKYCSTCGHDRACHGGEK